MSNKRNQKRSSIRQPKMGRNAIPVNYAEIGEDRPRSTEQIMRGEDPTNEPIRARKCRFCGQSNGTLRNAGTKQYPLWEHMPSCRKRNENN